MKRQQRRLESRTPLSIPHLLFTLLGLFVTPAMAYTDPGSGTLLIQVIVATFFGGMFYFRKLIREIFRHKD